jgi:Cytochrome c, mono- and diheme variants
MNKRGWIALAVTIATALPVMAAGPDAAATFKSKCAMCHGPDGAGQTPSGKMMKVRDLRSAEVQKQGEKALEATVTNGKGKMPAFKTKLSEAEIDSLVKLVLTFKK